MNRAVRFTDVQGNRRVGSEYTGAEAAVARAKWLTENVAAAAFIQVVEIFSSTTLFDGFANQDKFRA